MKKLMISLDKNILQKDSIVARRMIEYGKKDELFIIIPSRKKEMFDLSEAVHAYSTGGNKLQQLFRLKKIGKHIIVQNNIEEITAQDPFFTGLVGLFLKKHCGIVEVQLHGDFLSGYYGKQWLAKFVLKHASKIRVVGERIRQSVLKLGIAEEKIIVKPVQHNPEVIKNWISRVNVKNTYPVYERIFLVLGRIEPVKNITWLVNVFKEVVEQKNYLLLIVGRGSEEEKIKKYIIEAGLENNVKLQNWTEDPYSYLKTVDCVLFPSLSEGYGLVAMEANLVGTPLIMNDVGVANYELKPSEKVTILPINDKEKWKEAILKI